MRMFNLFVVYKTAKIQKTDKMAHKYFLCSANYSKNLFPNLDLLKVRKKRLYLRPNTLLKMTDTETTLLESKSGEFTEIKPLYASQHGCSRLFTARYNGKKVILKALKEAYANDKDCQLALQNEYEVTSVLDNKYIRKAVGFVQIDNLGKCLVLEFIEGKSLLEHVRVGTLSTKQVKNIIVEVCDALYYMHRNRIVHCNLKPENILVTANDCRAKIIDIGIPKTEPKADRELLIKEMEYVAPEIIKGEEFDARADIFSIGKIMEFINERNISAQFNNIATHCTQFSREQRFDSISEVKSAITKGHSIITLIIVGVVVAIALILAMVLIPRIKENMAKEKAERIAVDFSHVVENMQAETATLCEKYRLTSLKQPIAPNWADDSLRFVEVLVPFYSMEDYSARVLDALEAQRNTLIESRQRDFDSLLLNTFKTTDDSLAVSIKQTLIEPNDSLLFIEAAKWFQQTK